MSCYVNGEKYVDLGEIRLCDITPTQVWEAVEKGILPKPIYPEQKWYPYWKEETINEFWEWLDKQ